MVFLYFNILVFFINISVFKCKSYSFFERKFCMDKVSTLRNIIAILDFEKYKNFKVDVSINIFWCNVINNNSN